MIAHEMDLLLGGQRLRVRVEGNASLERWLQRTYAVTPRHGRNGRADVEILGRTLRTCGRLRACTSAAHVRAEAEYALVCHAMERAQRRHFTLHAAWVARERSSALIAGRHGWGKTTLSVALALERGWRVLADDMVIVTAGGDVRALERPVRLKPGIAEALPLLSGLRLDRAPWRDGWPLMVPLRRFGRPGPSPGRPRLIVILGTPGGSLTTQPLTHGLVVGHLARFVSGLRGHPAEVMRAVTALTARASAWRLRGGTVQERCSAIESLTN